MTKLETLKKQEWECVFELIDYQINTNNDILSNFRCSNFNKEEMKRINEEQELLKCARKKLSNIAKREMIVAYD